MPPYPIIWLARITIALIFLALLCLGVILLYILFEVL